MLTYAHHDLAQLAIIQTRREAVNFQHSPFYYFWVAPLPCSAVVFTFNMAIYLMLISLRSNTGKVQDPYLPE
jgi:hypothetical protein